MIAALSRFAAAALTLGLFVAIALLYVVYGRPLIGLDGNMELATWAIALWKTGGLLAEAGNETMKVFENAAQDKKTQTYFAIAVGVVVAVAAGLYIAKTAGVL
jgi:hypothetical protein